MANARVNDPWSEAEHAAIQALMQAAPLPVLTLTEQGDVSWANHAAHALLDASAERRWEAVLPPQFMELLQECLQTGTSVRQRRDPTSAYLWSCVPSPLPHRAVALIGWAVQDEAQMDQLRHLSSIGELCAGIAHEINTPMQYIGDNIAFLGDSFASFQRLGAAIAKLIADLRETPLAPAAEELERLLEAEEMDYLLEETTTAIRQTSEGIGRVVSIARAIKDFSHVTTGESAPADLNQAIETTLTVARNELKYVADVRTELGDIPLVSCRLSEVHQVLLNLLVNAAHAVDDRIDRQKGERGEIHVRTRATEDRVIIEIEDTGTGIPEEARPRIFERFFTTKRQGRGTGQGLAIAKRVVEDLHGGTLRFETELGRGTTFFVELPIVAVESRGSDV
jgi:signal transduction histidine kinase